MWKLVQCVPRDCEQTPWGFSYLEAGVGCAGSLTPKHEPLFGRFADFIGMNAPVLAISRDLNLAISRRYNGLFCSWLWISVLGNLTTLVAQDHGNMNWKAAVCRSCQ